MSLPGKPQSQMSIADGVDSQQTARPSLREIWAGLVRPAFSDPHFWIVQGMVAAVFFIVLAGDLAQDAHITVLPGFVWIVLLFVPVTYGGKHFGLVGSLGAALSGIILVVPEVLLLHHSATQQWGAWIITAIMIVVAFVTGDHLEEIQAIKRALTATDDLAKSQQLSRIVFENSAAAIGIADIKGNLLEVNAHTARWWV
ncbi:MAG: hypothetical protein ACYDHP_03745 [Ferrimicrobium sp.]